MRTFRFMKLWLYTFLLCLIGHGSWATHNRSGEITYSHIAGNTYSFTVTTCTKLSSAANRDKIEIDFGDGFTDTLLLSQFFDYPSTDTKQNIFTGQHTFTGPGIYTISVTDPNRNDNVLNITNSVNQIFCIQTELIISPFLGTPNNSLVFGDCPCPEKACTQSPWIYPLGCYDPDGDSLHYEIIGCKGVNCADMPIPSVFQFPQAVAGGAFEVDPVFGILTWDSPGLIGEFNFAIKVSEYRNGVKIGHVIRDMQLTVEGSCNNNPPQISNIQDTCIHADSLLTIPLKATDTSAGPGDTPSLHWSHYGLGFQLSNNPASFNILSNNTNPIEAIFSWKPGCELIQKEPYLFTFQAEDTGPFVPLKDVKTLKVRITGNEIQNLQLSAFSNQVNLNWDPFDCPSIVGYRVYRNIDSLLTDTVCCDQSPEEVGYQLIGTTTSKDSVSFIDEGNLSIGNRYCYTVTAIYPRGAESCMAIPVCMELPFDVPVMTQASVDSTSVNFGTDTIRWSPPLELDTNLYTGPYWYQIYRGSQFAYPDILIGQTNPSNFLLGNDHFFADNGLATTDSAYTYRVELMSDQLKIGSATPAQTIHLKAIPNDNEIGLYWEVPVPWTNFTYEIYKSTEASNSSFVKIAEVDTNYFVDDSLVNGLTYCYRIRSIGRYTHPLLPDTLYNWSQYLCTEAFDFTPPCPVSQVQVSGDCESLGTAVTWINPDPSCADDVVSLHIYYAPHPDSSFVEIKAIASNSDTSFSIQKSNSIAGCYYVTAKDSVQYNNESEPSNVVCIDNCDPVYHLPNVFTPNNDNANQLYTPIFPFKFVDHVEFSVHNRWGEEVYYTEDPNLNWNGFDQKENLPLTEGVYFYTCKVYAIRLNGLESFNLSGFIHLIYNK